MIEIKKAEELKTPKRGRKPQTIEGPKDKVITLIKHTCTLKGDSREHIIPFSTASKEKQKKGEIAARKAVKTHQEFLKKVKEGKIKLKY